MRLELYAKHPLTYRCSETDTSNVDLVPLGQPIMKAIPALMAGNCCIVKTSPFTPYSGMKVVELAQKFLPPGVLQVLSGDDRLGPWLTHHTKIDKISFTGSTASGKKVAEAAAKSLKRVTLELWVALTAHRRDH